MLKAKKFKEDRQRNTLFFCSFGLVMLGIIVILTIGNIKQSQRKKELTATLNNLQEEAQALQGQKEDLLTEISKAQSKTYFEKIARDNLNLKKEGEKVVGFVKEEGGNQEEPTSTNKSFWQRVLERFGIR